MTKKSSIPGTPEAWEEGDLGKAGAHVRKASVELKQEIDDALGLQAISIRLPKATIDTYKMIAEIHGIGYQPLMRDAICRWVESELKQLLKGAVQSQRTLVKNEQKRNATVQPTHQHVDAHHLKKAA